MKDALAIHRDLLAAGVPHEIVRLRRVVLSADELPSALGLPAEQCVAVRMYDADDQLTAIAVPAGVTPAPSAVLAATGARRIAAAPVSRVNAVTEFAAPLVAPLLLPDEVPVVLDASLAAREVLYTATGESGTALGIHSRDLIDRSGARITNLVSPVVSIDDELRTLLPPGAPSAR